MRQATLLLLALLQHRLYVLAGVPVVLRGSDVLQRRVGIAHAERALLIRAHLRRPLGKLLRGGILVGNLDRLERALVHAKLQHEPERGLDAGLTHELVLGERVVPVRAFGDLRDLRQTVSRLARLLVQADADAHHAPRSQLREVRLGDPLLQRGPLEEDLADLCLGSGNGVPAAVLVVVVRDVAVVVAASRGPARRGFTLFALRQNAIQVFVFEVLVALAVLVALVLVGILFRLPAFLLARDVCQRLGLGGCASRSLLTGDALGLAPHGGGRIRGPELLLPASLALFLLARHRDDALSVSRLRASVAAVREDLLAFKLGHAREPRAVVFVAHQVIPEPVPVGVVRVLAVRALAVGLRERGTGGGGGDEVSRGGGTRETRVW